MPVSRRCSSAGTVSARFGDQDHEGETGLYIDDARKPADKALETCRVPVIDVLGMVAKPDDIAATREIGELEPGLVRHGQQELAGAERYQALKRALRFEQVFEDFQRHDEIIVAVVKLRIEQVRTGKGLAGPALPR